MRGTDEFEIKLRALTISRLRHRQTKYYRNGLVCHDCIYFGATVYSRFVDKQDGIYASHGECRKNPPVPAIDGDGEAQSSWPTVRPDEDWCGEHVTNESPLPDFESVWEECYAEVEGSAKEEKE